jgi:hypothetical protein
MTIKFMMVGTSTVLAIPKSRGELCDFLIQNLSGNDVYLVDSDTAGIAQGIKISAGGAYSCSDSDENVWLIASGAGSDVRVRWFFYPDWRVGRGGQ